MLSYNPAKFDGLRHSPRGDLVVLSRDLARQHGQGSFDFMDRSPSR